MSDGTEDKLDWLLAWPSELLENVEVFVIGVVISDGTAPSAESDIVPVDCDRMTAFESMMLDLWIMSTSAPIVKK